MVLLEVVPGFSFIFVVKNKSGDVVFSIVDSEDGLSASAPFKAVWDLEEIDVLAVSAVLNALGFAAKLVDGMLLHKSCEVAVESLKFLLIGLNSRGNGLNEFTSELLTEGINLVGSILSIADLLLKLFLGNGLELESASALPDAVEILESKCLGVKALNSAILIAGGVDLSIGS